MPPAIFIETAGLILIPTLSFLPIIVIIWVALYHSSVNVRVNLGHHVTKHHHVCLEGLRQLVILWGEELVREMEVVRVGEILVNPFVLAVTNCLVILRDLFR